MNKLVDDSEVKAILNEVIIFLQDNSEDCDKELIIIMAKMLKEKCVFVKGAKNAAIYDLENKKVYALNSLGKSIVEDLIIDSSWPNIESIEYISKLESLGLIEEIDLYYPTDRKKTVNPGCQLSFAWLELTNNCNLHCIHCYGQFGSQVFKSKNLVTMTVEDWKRILHELKANECKAIQFIGGEPLCFLEFREILTYAYDIGIENITVFTNGTLVDENFIKLAQKTRTNVRVSLYGHNSQIHESITGIKGSFQMTENALILLKKHSIPTKIAVTIMNANQSYIDNIKDYIESLGHKYSGYDTIRQVTGNVNCDYCVTDIEVLKKRYRTFANFSVSESQYINNLYWNNCWKGKVAITANGDVLPCIFSRNTVIGNLLTDTFSNIMKKALSYWTITLDQVEGCKDCEYRYACYNCRALAMSTGGSINSKELRCCYDPYEGSWRDIQECTKEFLQLKFNSNEKGGVKDGCDD